MPAFSHCAYCHEKLDIPDIPDLDTELDHVIPKDRGGCECPENKVDSCRACNRGKSTLTPLEYYNKQLDDEAFDEGGYTLQERQDALLRAAHWEARARRHLSKGCPDRGEDPFYAGFK